MTITLWHNPRCSKSRQALQILTDSGHTFTTRFYLNDPPDTATIRNTLQKLSPAQTTTPRTLMRTNDTLYKDLKLDDPTRSDDELIEAMANHPALIERPVVITDTRAIIGRPPEDILQIL